MKILAMFNPKKLLKSLWDKQAFVAMVVFLFAFGIPGSEASTVQAVNYNYPPSQLALLSYCDADALSALGLPIAKSIKNPISGEEQEVSCTQGAWPNLLCSASNIIGLCSDDLSFVLDSDLYVASTAQAPEVTAERQKRFEWLAQRGGGGLFAASQGATYALMDQRPASGAIFTDEVLAKIIYPDVVSAQESDDIEPYFPGTGFELLSPIRTLWGYFTGVSYSIMIILVVVVAMALMFRSNLGGEQTIQLQTAIPGIVMAMILIPLSYPISGLFIDGITLGTNAVHGFLFGPLGPLNEVYEDPTDGIKDIGLTDRDLNRGLYADDPRVNVFNFHALFGYSGANDTFQNTAEDIICPENSLNICTFLGGTATGGGTVGAGIALATFNPLAALFGVALGLLGAGELAGNFISSTLVSLVFLFLQLFIFFTSMRIAWKLFKQFLTMMLLPMMSPLIFAALAIPGRGNSMVIWYLKRMGNVTINFIVAYALILMSLAFSSPAMANLLPQGSLDGGVTQYEPPLIAGGIVNTVIGGANSFADTTAESGIPFIFVLLSFGLFFIIPGILQQITDALAPKEENPLAKLFTQEVGTTANFAFRQVPSVGIRAASVAAPYARSGIRSIAGYRASAAAPSRAEQLVENSIKPFTDRFGGDAMFGGAVRRAGAGIANTLQEGAGEEINAEKADFKITLINVDPSNSSINGGNITLLNMSTNSYRVKFSLLLEKEEGAQIPIGAVAFANVEKTGFPQRVEGGDVTPNVYDVAIDSSQVDASKSDDFTIVTNQTMSLKNPKPVINFSVDLRGIASGQSYSPWKGKVLTIFVGSIKKKFPITISARTG